VLAAVSTDNSSDVKLKPEKLSDAVKLVTEKLYLAGVPRPEARDVAKVAFAAFITGCTLSVRGSMATYLSDVLAIALFGKSPIRVRVPIGLIDPIDFSGVESSDKSDFLFEQANMSCPSAYAPELLADSKCPEFASRRRIIFALCEGASALPVSATYSELGPIIHTDAIQWKSKMGELSKLQKHEMPYDWPIQTSDGDFVNELNAILSILKVAPNASLEIKLRNALPVLDSIIQENNGEEPNHSTKIHGAKQLLIRWWIVPYLQARNIDIREISEIVKLSEDDQALGRLMTLGPSGDRAYAE
jgi:hypothetical protein